MGKDIELEGKGSRKIWKGGVDIQNVHNVRFLVAKNLIQIFPVYKIKK